MFLFFGGQVKWVRMIYEDFSTFTKDQEYLISIDKGLDYVEGSVIVQQSPSNNWRSSFFSSSHQAKITSLISKRGIIYYLEVVKYYDDQTADTVDEVITIYIYIYNLPIFHFLVNFRTFFFKYSVLFT